MAKIKDTRNAYTILMTKTLYKENPSYINILTGLRVGWPGSRGSIPG